MSSFAASLSAANRGLIKRRLEVYTSETEMLRARVSELEAENAALRASVMAHENDCAALPEDCSVTETIGGLNATIEKLIDLDSEHCREIIRLRAIIERATEPIATLESVWGREDYIENVAVLVNGCVLGWYTDVEAKKTVEFLNAAFAKRFEEE